MIRYALVCDKGHTFESWFQNSAAYDKQAKRGLVGCPVCGSAKVEKAIMAPRARRHQEARHARADRMAPAEATCRAAGAVPRRPRRSR